MRRASAIPDGLQLFTPRQVAALLAVSGRTVAAMLACGELASVKVRACRRIPRQAVEAYLDGQAGRREGAPPADGIPAVSALVDLEGESGGEDIPF